MMRALGLTLVAASIVGAASCGSSETCDSALFDYGGAKSGAIWFTIVSDDAGRSLSSAQGIFLTPTPPWRNVSSPDTCYGNAAGPDIPITATAWLDTTGEAMTNCATSDRPLCKPEPTDPQAQQKAVLRAGEHLILHFTLVDPP